MQKFISIEPMDPGTVHESTGLLQPDRVAPDNEIFNTLSSSSSSSSSAKEALASLSPSAVGLATKSSNSDSVSDSGNAFFSSPVAQKSSNANTGEREPVVFSPFVINAEAPIVTTQIDTPLTLSISDVYNPPAAGSVSGIPSGGVSTSKSREMRANKEPKSIRK
jgi:hypothetical protein